MEKLWETIELDKKTFAQKGNVEKLFVIELARFWIGMHAKTKAELSEKVSALAAILHTPEFQKTISLSNELSQDFDPQKAEQAAELIVTLSQSEIYAKYSSLEANCGTNFSLIRSASRALSESKRFSISSCHSAHWMQAR